MSRLRLIIISLCIISCTQTKKTEEASAMDSISIDSIINNQIADRKPDEVIQDEEECVFDTSTYKFTSKALNEYDKNLSFRWDRTTANAYVRLNEVDSLILHIGGCSHFSYSAIFITDSSKFQDREYLIQKTKWLAKSFFSNGFDDKYIDCIEKKLYRLEEPTRKDFLYYSIVDQDTIITDHIYEGWTFEKIGSKTKISLVGYQN